MQYLPQMRKHLKLLTISISLLFIISIFCLYWIVTSQSLSPQVSEPLNNFNQIDLNINLNSLQILSKTAELKSSNILHDRRVQSLDLFDKTKTNLVIKSNEDIENQNELEATEKEINERITRVDNLCRKYHLGKYKWSNGSNDLNLKEPPTSLYSYFFWHRERHLAWCPVYKAGSTSWLHNMMILAGYSEDTLKHPPKQLSILAREVYGDMEPDQETMEQTMKLLVVRHPFDRLISAYVDKLSNASSGPEHGTHHFYKKYGEKIVKKFRKSFTSNLEKEPTWEEFIRYLLSTDLIQYSDDHWLPAYYSCTPCLVSYDVIAKLETYSRDQKFIIYKAGLSGLIKPKWNHKQNKDISGEERVKKYFGMLSKKQIYDLYRKYWFDFEIFDYDYQSYLQWGV